MHLIISRFQHETNTFSAIPTPPESFVSYWGEAAQASLRGSDWPMAPMIEMAQHTGATFSTPVAAEADPGNRVADVMFERVAAALLTDIGQGCDGILLELHGAMATESVDDAEGELLARLRAAAPGALIAVSLDLHANVTRKMIDNVDILVGYKTYPHVDYRQTGAHVAELARRALGAEIQPLTRWRQVPILAHTLAMGTDNGPMKEAIRLAREAEQHPAILAVSVFGGFPLSDISDAGVSVVVTADGNADLAQQVADRIADMLWLQRKELIYKSPPTSTSLAMARALAEGPGVGPVLLFDHSDNVYSGGTGDSMDVLQAALEAGLEGIVTSPFCDPEAVAVLWSAGAGAKVEVEIGNKVALPFASRKRKPLRLTGKVLCLHDGEIAMPDSIYGAYHQSLGRTVVFDTGSARIVVSEKRNEPCDVKLFTDLGIDPSEAPYLLIKSRMHCKPIFLPMARGLVQCDSDRGGPTSSQIDLFPIQKMRRPLYPLDRDFDWTPV